MKKIALYTVLTSGLLATGLSFASAAPVMPMPTFTGFFAGVDLGVRALQIQQITIDSTPDSGGSNFTNNNTEAQPTEGLNIGYGYEFSNQVYLGAKLFGQIAQGGHTVSSTRSFADIPIASRIPQRFGNLYGINGQLGYAVTPRFLPYLTVGAEWLNVQYSNELAIILLGPDTHIVASDEANINKYTSGWDAGLGVKFMLTDHWLVNAEFTGAWFSSQQTTADYTLPFGGGVVTSTLKVTPNVFSGLVGMSYLFDF